jgi:hypothetical protein
VTPLEASTVCKNRGGLTIFPKHLNGLTALRCRFLSLG